jgi:hypothetical protein
MKDAYGKIPYTDKNTEFSHFKGGIEKPVKIFGWQFSNTFGRWSALVEFSDGMKGYTYPHFSSYQIKKQLSEKRKLLKNPRAASPRKTTKAPSVYKVERESINLRGKKSGWVWLAQFPRDAQGKQRAIEYAKAYHRAKPLAGSIRVI